MREESTVANKRAREVDDGRRGSCVGRDGSGVDRDGSGASRDGVPVVDEGWGGVDEGLGESTRAGWRFGGC